MQTSIEKNSTWLDRHAYADVKLNWEKIIFAAIVILAIVTRFYKLGPRVMSHDENSHVYYSWLLYQGNGYQHDPITHGPFQFHIVAASYFIFGAGDISARLPAVLFSIATVIFTWNYRRYLGRAGALIAGLLFTISPYMLYYGRYVRNEAFVAFCGVMMLWAVFRYLETGQSRYLIWVTVANVLHFTIKETAYIYAAELMLFLGLYFVYRITRRPWLKEGHRFWFLISLTVTVTLIGLVVYLLSLKSGGAQPAAAVSVTAGETATHAYSGLFSHPLLAGLVLVGVVVSLAAAVYLLAKGFTWPRVRQERSFDLLIVFGTLLLPLLSAFPLKAIGWPVPTNATTVNAMTTIHILQMGLVVGLMMAIAIGVGLWWNRRLWLVNAAVFYAIFTFFYTTYFTNTDGFFTGLLGSLGYWMAQQAVERGTQPWYYYIFLQIPIYEFLPALGSLCALMFIRRKRQVPTSEFPAMEPAGLEDISQEQPPTPHVPVIGLLGFWAISSVVSFSYAGEKMPWLTVHITLPLILVAAWAFGRLIETTDWSVLRPVRGRLTLLLLPVLVLSLAMAIGILLSTHPPLHGKSTAELQSTGLFFFLIFVALASGWGIHYTARGWSAHQLRTSLLLTIFSLLGVLTARAAFMASYINYDRATEYLVYAHSAPGIKEALTRIEDISRRTTQTLALKVAYDSETSYPYWWYLRDYPNQLGFGSNPSRELRDYPVILVGEKNYSKVEPVVKQDFYLFDYIRLWWPNEDYKKITWSSIDQELRSEAYAKSGSAQQSSSMTVFKYLGRVWSNHVGPFFWNAKVREAVWDIWFNRDYTKYASLTGHGDLTLSTWSPSDRMRMYISKDVANQLWDYGPQTSVSQEEQDPYLGKQVELEADIILGPDGGGTTQFQNSRAIAIAPDGSLYVADTADNRIIHLSPDGTELGGWGSSSPGCPYSGDPPAYVAIGTFCEPWGIAVGPDGSVYVADTWNHRVQKFTADGEPLKTWGKGIMSSDPNDLLGFYGPRGIAVDSKGRVFLADTGNSRVVVFDAEGNPLMQIGGEGYALGQFAEPVGIAVDSAGLLYVADTWNQRVQVFVPTENSLTPLTSWDIYGWKSNSVNNKPYITVDSSAHVFVTDPEGFRVLEFSNLGEIVRIWGDIGTDATTFSLPTGLVADTQGGIWVVDTDNHRLMHFTLPK